MTSQWLGSMPPPPGVEPNFIDPYDHMKENIALHSVLLTITTLAVGMRLYTRSIITKAKLGVDDYFCVISYFLTVGFSVFMFLCYHKGIGRHLWNVPVQWVVDMLKFFTIGSYIYLLASGCVKLTFLFFYYRIFSGSTKMRYLIIAGIVLTFGFTTSLFFGTVFSCIPVERAWNPIVPGHCLNPVYLPYVSGVSSSALDLYTLILPVPVVVGLNMDLKRKFKVVAVFGIGLFACAASLVRLGMTPILRSNPDASWNLSWMAVWATVEINVGLICACLMLLPAFLNHVLEGPILNSMSRLFSGAFGRLSGRRTQESKSPIGGHDTWVPYVEQRDSDSQFKGLNNHQMTVHAR
ncbi:GPCR, PTH11-type [Trichoderma citrinoviride]|uniref:GPCR, PTH11-type n=1 Tax=Trichoderma citrinoviride TaxID=58853 RepID=A0A2T4B9P2_9HYPO|nr:GPCR, PTH11-type [Trichoderma citrinoviride]PTB66043.1 GPCR, PTH11-type [Trichoderma citrinoviride]